MANERIYRHNIRCPERGSNWVCKNEHQKNDKQKYKCNNCNRYFTENPDKVYLTKKEMEEIILIFLEEMYPLAIARLIKKNYDTVHNHIYRER